MVEHKASKSHMARYREISNILSRHGLGYFTGVIGLDWLIPFHRGWLGHPRRPERYTQPEHIRMALEELGTTAIKLGQTLSTRADLLPPAYQVEIAKLQDAAPSVPEAKIEQVLREEFGCLPEEIFASFDRTPLAAASIGQAHAATLPDGTEVVVKIRRPGVVEQVNLDLDILLTLASRANQRWKQAEQYDLVGLTKELSDTLRAELDYVREARNAERFASNFLGSSDIHIPQIYWDQTTSRVITMGRVRGIKINDLLELDEAGIDRKILAERSAMVFLQMVFEDGFFHADPHPGNFFVETSGRIGLIDFGMVGVVDEQTQEMLVDLAIAIVNQNANLLVNTVLDLGVSQHKVDRLAFRRDLNRLVSHYYGMPLGELKVNQMINETMVVVREHRLQLPSNLKPQS